MSSRLGAPLRSLGSTARDNRLRDDNTSKLIVLKPKAIVDFCDGDPNLVIAEDKDCPNSNSILLSVLHLRTNPYHALHDVAWAVAHYMRNCVDDKKRAYVYLNVSIFDAAMCKTPTVVPSKNGVKFKYPTWGACLLYVTAVSMGFPEENIFTGMELSQTVRCFAKVVNFGAPGAFEPAGFRALNLFGKVRERAERRHPSSSSHYVALPKKQKGYAFRNISYFVQRGLNGGRPLKRENASVNVLIYDRGETRRRKWIDANTFYSRIKDDPRLVVNFIQATPKSFKEQVLLYHRADIVVAPHGANMANTVFMAPGADVIEIYPCCQVRGNDIFKFNDGAVADN